MGLNIRLLALMLNCHAISHSDLKELFKDFKSDKEILEGIVVIAVNIKGTFMILTQVSKRKMTIGIWIIKSEYLYTSRPKQARDILLLTLLNNGFLDRAQWTNSTGIDATMSLNMVGEICVLEDRKWRLKVVEDGSALFAKR